MRGGGGGGIGMAETADLPTVVIGEPREPTIFNRLLVNVLLVVFAVLFAWSVAYLALGYELTKTLVLQFVCVTLFSGLVAFTELLSRYNENPGRLLAGVPTAVYLIINMFSGIAALGLIKFTDILETSGQLRPFYEAMAASFGATIVFRSSLFTTRIGGEDVDVGPSAFLKSLLNATDTMIKRREAQDRAELVGWIMRNVSFERGSVALPAFCLAVVGTVSPEEQTSLASSIMKLSGAEGTDEWKAMMMGTVLMQTVGPEVLRQAVVTLGRNIQSAHRPPA
jgi:hypothetical protein